MALIFSSCLEPETFDPHAHELEYLAVKKKVLEYMSLGMPEEAEQHFDSLVYRNPRNYHYYVFAGDLKLRNRKIWEALDLYQNAAKLYETEEIYERLANIYYTHLQDTVHYLLSITKLLKLRPDKPGYYIEYAKYFESQGIYGLAIEYVTKARYLVAPDDLADIYVMRSRLHFRFGDLSAAISDCDTAILIQKDHCPAHIQRTTLYLETGENRKAARSAGKALTLGCDQGALFYRRGLSRYRQDDIMGAREDMIRSLERKNAEAIYYISHLADHRFRVLIPRKYWDPE